MPENTKHHLQRISSLIQSLASERLKIESTMIPPEEKPDTLFGRLTSYLSDASPEQFIYNTQMQLANGLKWFTEKASAHVDSNTSALLRLKYIHEESELLIFIREMMIDMRALDNIVGTIEDSLRNRDDLFNKSADLETLHHIYGVPQLREVKLVMRGLIETFSKLPLCLEQKEPLTVAYQAQLAKRATLRCTVKEEPFVSDWGYQLPTPRAKIAVH